MRSTTHVFIGINNIGEPSDPPAVFSGTIVESLAQMVQWLTPRSMATRFDVVIARSEEEARGALRIRERSTNGNGGDLVNELTRLMEGADNGTTD